MFRLSNMQVCAASMLDIVVMMTIKQADQIIHIIKLSTQFNLENLLCVYRYRQNEIRCPNIIYTVWISICLSGHTTEQGILLSAVGSVLMVAGTIFFYVRCAALDKSILIVTYLISKFSHKI